MDMYNSIFMRFSVAISTGIIYDTVHTQQVVRKRHSLAIYNPPYNLHLHQKQFLSCWPLPVVDFIASYQTLLLLGGQ